MRYFNRLSYLLTALLLLGVASETQAQVSNCERALGEAFLDVNNTRARILNTGGLFYRGEPHVYEIPKGSGSNAIFASGIWVAGNVGGQLRAAATRYGEWEFWAGPLDENGAPPVDCAVYDRVFKVSRSDVDAFKGGAAATRDMRDWPTGLGAPTLAPPANGVDDDADGEVDEDGEQIAFDINVPLASRVNRVVDLAGGELPAILGDQSIWAVFNDRGNTHESSDAPDIGLEVHMTAFAFNVAGHIGNTTFYKYNLFYKGTVPLEDAWLGIFSDPDLGDFADDYVGSDTTLGIGYVYNSDGEDISGEGYGSLPPAAGYDFFQGPIVPSTGDTASVSGVKVPDFRNLGMEHFVFYNNGGCVICDPVTGQDYFNYMSGRWKDGQQVTFGGNGRDFSEIPTDYMFTGDPATLSGWTEFTPNGDGTGQPIDPGDRRFVLSTGPFQINPGDQQEIIFGLVWAQGTDNLDSVAELRKADALAQAAFDINFALPPAPDAPSVTVTELDQQVIIEWSNSSGSNNFLEKYSVIDPFTETETSFEGYDVIEYADEADQVGTVIATYDVTNGITQVIDGPPDGSAVSEVTATGNDGGVQRFHRISNLTNSRTYNYGVQAYAHNLEAVGGRISRSPVTRVEASPGKSQNVLSDDAIGLSEATPSTATSTPDDADFSTDNGGVSAAAVGEGRVWASVINPAALTGQDYSVVFYEVDDGTAPSTRAEIDLTERDFLETDAANFQKSARETYTTYDVRRGDGAVVFDGSATGEPAPQRANIIQADGLQISVVGPDPGIKGFLMIANGAGPLDPFDMAAFAFNSSGFPIAEETGLIPAGTHPNADRPTSGVNQSTNASTWGWHTGGSGRTAYSTYLDRTLFGRGHTIGGSLGASNFEFRFTQACVDDPTSCIGFRRFEDDMPMEIPFEIWNAGVSPGPEDDIRLFPAILDAGGEVWSASVYPDTVYSDLDTFDISGDHDISGGANDPYTDWVYWFEPADASIGDAGYQAWATDCRDNGLCNGSAHFGRELQGRTVLVNWNGWSHSDPNADPNASNPYDQVDSEMLETGSIIQQHTLKPSLPGDTFTITTEGLGAADPTAASLAQQLEDIYVVPNPYKGASSYERSQLTDEVRFTNLPETATIRVYTLNGTLVKTLNKRGSERVLKWDLATDGNFPLASGLYLVHVETSFGSKVIKFGVVKKRVQLGVF